jgi:NIMA-interacting peptidyl-prolyl cis-trans isomerase 4
VREACQEGGGFGKAERRRQFDEVAREFSEDKARQGGSLGWKTKGSLDPKFEEVAFALETSTTANPKFVEVKTEFGYHIIMVEGRK